MPRSERARRAFAMDAEPALFAIDGMLFDLCDVMADIVNQREAQFFGADGERFHEGLLRLAHDDLPIGPGIVCRGGHGSQVILAFG